MIINIIIFQQFKKVFRNEKQQKNMIEKIKKKNSAAKPEKQQICNAICLKRKNIFGEIYTFLYTFRQMF